MRIYLDNAATTALDTAVIQEMTAYMTENYGNPSSIHADGRRARTAIEDARKRVAKYIGASIGEVFFTSGGTESNNMAIKNAVRDLGVERIISSPLEHHCGLHTFDVVAKHDNVEIQYLEVDSDGRISMTQLEEFLGASSKKTLVSLMHANNEIGTMIDLDAVGELCHQYGAFFHSDTVQTMTHFPIDVSKTKVHFLSAGAHKFHGPKGSGFIYINGDISIKPYIDGGAQERNMRGGTENAYGIIGLAKAMEMACENMEEHKSQILELRNYMKIKLLENFSNLDFNGAQDGDYLYTVLSVAFPPSPKADLLLLSLDIAGISASGGSACSSGAEGGSHVIAGLRKNPDAKTIRFSFSHHNTKEEIDFVIEKLKKILP